MREVTIVEKVKDILRKQYELPISIRAAEDGDDDYTLLFIGSDETVDRSGDIVKVDGWDLVNYKKNPVFLWAHDSRQMPIGKAVKVWVEDGKLKFKIKFAVDEYPFAKLAYDMYKGGYLNATSVGFMIKDWKFEDENFVSLSQELFELSAVPVPANPNALRLGFTDEQLNTLKKEWKGMQSSNISTKTVPTPTDEPVVKDIENEEDEQMDEATKALMEQMQLDIKSLSDSVKILTEEREARIKQLEAEELEKKELQAKLDAEKLEAEKIAAEEAEKLEAEKKAAEEAEKLEAEKKAVEEAAKLEAERIEAEKKALNFVITKDDLLEVIKNK